MLPHRIERVSEAVRETLSEIIHDNLRDPGIPAVFTLTRVEVSRDLRHAYVQYSMIPDDDASVDAASQALERAKGFLRRELGVRLELKYLPQLEFHFDPSPRHAQRIHQILGTLHPAAAAPPPPASAAPASAAPAADSGVESSTAGDDSAAPPVKSRSPKSKSPSASAKQPSRPRGKKKASAPPDDQR